MIIKQSAKTGSTLHHLRRLWKKKKYIISACIILFFVSVGFLSGYWFNKSGKISDVKIQLLKVIKAKNYIQALTTRPERVYMDIKLKHLQKLEKDRQLALERGFLSTLNADDLYVPVRFRFNGEEVKARVRLKGNSKSNRATHRWPLRVKVAGDNEIMGMKRFSLHDPVTKRYLDEWVFQRLLQYSGMCHLRYYFVELIINGDSDGIYALEENFEKNLILYNNLKEGIIIRFDEYWNYFYHFPQSMENPVELNTKSFPATPVDAYESNRISEDSVLSAQFMLARSMLEGYRLGKIPMNKVFCISDMAKLFAISDLLGQHHALEHRNMRFYFNPDTNLLYPIGYDLHDGIRLVKEGGAIGEGKAFVYPDSAENHILWEESFFRDTSFFKEYISYLDIFSEASFLEDFTKSVFEDYKHALRIVHRNNPGWNYPVFEIMKENQAYIKRLLNPLKGIETYFHGKRCDSLIFRIGSFHPLPLEVGNFSYKNRTILHSFNGKILGAKPHYEAMQFVETSIPLKSMSEENIIFDSLYLYYKMPGLDKLLKVNVDRFSNYYDDLVEDVLNK